MKDEILAHLHDIAEAGKAIRSFVSGRTCEYYSQDELLRSAVERKFEIMGEALNRVARDEPSATKQIGLQVAGSRFQASSVRAMAFPAFIR